MTMILGKAESGENFLKRAQNINNFYATFNLKDISTRNN